MKKLKKFWLENSVLLVLLLILIACLISISIVVFTYFVGDSSSKYGERLEEIENHPISKDIKNDIISKLEENELIENASIRVSDTKTIYLLINFTPKTTLVEAQSKALASLEYFSEDILGFYDVEFLIKADSTEDTEGFQIIGSRNVNGTGGIVWNNNTVIEKVEEE